MSKLLFNCKIQTSCWPITTRFLNDHCGELETSCCIPFDFNFDFSPGQTNIRSIYSSKLGQRWMAPISWSMAVYSSANSLHCVLDRWTQHFFPQILPLDSTSKPDYCLSFGTLVAYCNSYSSGVQFLPTRQVIRLLEFWGQT